MRLLVQLNDWSLRALGPREMKSGFGFLQAKPSTSFAPVAITPDELGAAGGSRRHLDLEVEWNGAAFGHPNGREMNFGFGGWSRTRRHAQARRRRHRRFGHRVERGGRKGSACIAERRVIEIIEHGAPRTGFMKFGDRVRMEARYGDQPCSAPSISASCRHRGRPADR